MAPLCLANLPCSLARILKDIFLVIISFITTSSVESTAEFEFEDHPSPSLVPLPHHFIIESTKEHLTAIKYDHILASLSNSCIDDCAVCLTVLKECEEVRGLPNCRHMFHKDCIDAWIDKCKTTCPICRTNLLPNQAERLKYGRDPWRRERMRYLFGHDSFTQLEI